MTRNEELRLEYMLTIIQEIEKNLNRGLNECRENFVKKDIESLHSGINDLIHFSKKEREENERD